MPLSERKSPSFIWVTTAKAFTSFMFWLRLVVTESPWLFCTISKKFLSTSNLTCSAAINSSTFALKSSKATFLFSKVGICLSCAATLTAPCIVSLSAIGLRHNYWPASAAPATTHGSRTKQPGTCNHTRACSSSRLLVFSGS